MRSPARNPPAIHTQPTRALLLPLGPLSLATIAAFAVAIRANLADLSSLWTQCASRPAPPTPLCFAILFFQTALASSRGRLEEAAIIALLAGLATVTAAEGARVRRGRDGRSEDENRRGGDSSHAGDGTGDGGLALTVIRNLTVPWLLYNLFLGALAWQAIIVPAFLHEASTRPARQRRPPPPPAAVDSLAIALGIATGLILPSTLMLLHHTTPATILLWLPFPLWTTLTTRLARAFLPRLPTPTALLYAAPVTYSAITHLLLAAHLLFPSAPSPPAFRAALALLELDHAAIFATYLYWVSREAGARAAGLAVGASLLLGPGAGVCLSWAYRDHVRHEGPRRLRGREKGGGRKATGHFFGGPDS